MNELTTIQVDSVVVALQQADGYVHATAMCQATGKRYNNYAQTKTTRDFLRALALVTGIPATDLVIVKQGGIPALKGTWVHPDVAVNLAQWCDARVGVAVAQLVNRWRRGEVDIPQTRGEALMLAAQKTLELERQEKVTLALARHAQEQLVELKAKDAIIEAQAPRMAMLDRILPDDSNLTYDMKDSAELLGLPKGSITLIELLQHMEYLSNPSPMRADGLTKAWIAEVDLLLEGSTDPNGVISAVAA